ncbi:MAG: hypothetical protein QG608_1211 [Actinomycetota bacterium]|nr:hypothetical protein [Actinomycetota bacterium]
MDDLINWSVPVGGITLAVAVAVVGQCLLRADRRRQRERLDVLRTPLADLTASADAGGSPPSAADTALPQDRVPRATPQQTFTTWLTEAYGFSLHRACTAHAWGRWVALLGALVVFTAVLVALYDCMIGNGDGLRPAIVSALSGVVTGVTGALFLRDSRRAQRDLSTHMASLSSYLREIRREDLVVTHLNGIADEERRTVLSVEMLRWLMSPDREDRRGPRTPSFDTLPGRNAADGGRDASARNGTRGRAGDRAPVELPLPESPLTSRGALFHSGTVRSGTAPGSDSAPD